MMISTTTYKFFFKVSEYHVPVPEVPCLVLQHIHRHARLLTAAT